MKRLWFAFLGLVAIAPAALAQTTDFPNRPVKIVVMSTSGSSADTSARVVGEQLGRLLGQPFVIDNRPGGDGVIANVAVKNAPADGYTILMGSNSPMSVNPVVKKGLPYDPVKDLKPIHGLIQSMNAVIVAGDSQLNTLADLVEHAKRGKALSVGTSFAGYHLAMEWLASLADFRFANVAYNGTAQVLTDVMGRHVDAGVVDLAVASKLIASGKLKALAVGGEARHPDFPNVPTVRESGYPEYFSFAWVALFVRAETPAPVAAKLADAVKRALETAEWKDFVKRLGVQTLPLGPEEMSKFHMEDIARYRRVAEAAGIKPE